MNISSREEDLLNDIESAVVRINTKAKILAPEITESSRLVGELNSDFVKCQDNLGHVTTAAYVANNDRRSDGNLYCVIFLEVVLLVGLLFFGSM